MPAEKPSTEISSGYTETPDGLTTMGYTTQPESQPAYTRTVQYPNGNVVAFPDTLSEQEFASAAKNAWTQLSNSPAGRFVSGAYSTTLGALADVAHQYWTTTTTPAKQPGANFVNDLATSILNGHIDQAKKAATAWKDGRLVEAAGHAIAAAAPLVGPAAAQAGEAIGKGDVAGGLGQGAGLVAGALLGGKAAEGTEEAEAAAKPASLKTIAAPEPGLKAPAPMTEAERAAAAYTHRTFGPDQAEVQLLGHQVNETAPSEMQHGSGIERESAGAPTEQEINDFIRQHYGDKAPTIKIVEEAESKPASSEDINQAAEAEAKKLRTKEKAAPPRLDFKTEEGQTGIKKHIVTLNGGEGELQAIEDPSTPGTWKVRSAALSEHLQGSGKGRAMLEHLVKNAEEQGVEQIRSDGVVSDQQATVYRALKRKGFDVTEHAPKTELSTPTFTINVMKLPDAWPSVAQQALSK